MTSGVDGALAEPTRALHRVRRFVEDLDEDPADGLAFCLWIREAFQRTEELLSCLYSPHIQPHMDVVVEYRGEFVLAQQAVVDEDALEPVADGPTQQFRRDRRVDAPAEPEDDAIVAEFFAQGADGFFDEARGRPVPAAAADSTHEVVQELRALDAVPDLWMELYAPNRTLPVPEPGIRHIVRPTNGLKLRPQLLNRIAVAHPHLRPLLHSFEERIGVVQGHQVGPAVFPAV